MRNTTDIIAEMHEVAKLRDNYNNLQNEGATDGYNPYEARLAKLSDEFSDAKIAERDAEWTEEVFNERRDWFNSQGFSSPSEAVKACKDQGWGFHDLMEMKKKYVG